MKRISYSDEMLIQCLIGNCEPSSEDWLLPDDNVYYTPEEAYAMLKAATGEDFGYDGDAWREYFYNRALEMSKWTQEQWD